jgi:catechol 2,3-dioxygenase-like lactoylglutathione lyase family enzyme
VIQISRELGARDIIAFVPTTNAQLAREFYEQKLGLKFVSDDGFALSMGAAGRTGNLERPGRRKGCVVQRPGRQRAVSFAARLVSRRQRIRATE